MARCTVTADAEKVGTSSHVPWPEPERYRYVFPIQILEDRAAPVESSWQRIDELGHIGRVPASQFPQVPDKGVGALRALFTGIAAVPGTVDVRVLPPIDMVYLETDRRTLIERAIAYRRGQGRFRSALLDSYRGRCLVTETEEPDVLEAAHIHPYRGEHTDRVDNGVLLRSDVHTLFDLHKVTILPNAVVRVHPSLHGTEYDFDHRRVQFPVSEAGRPNADLLRQHNGECAWLR